MNAAAQAFEIARSRDPEPEKVYPAPHYADECDQRTGQVVRSGLDVFTAWDCPCGYARATPGMGATAADAARADRAEITALAWRMTCADPELVLAHDGLRRFVVGPRYERRPWCLALDRTINASVKRICLSGTSQTGKTTALAAALWVRVKADPERWGASTGARWYHVPKLAAHPWRSYDHEPQTAELRGALRGCALLVLDDLGVESSQGDTAEWVATLHGVLDSRRLAGLETWVSTHLGGTALMDRYGRALVSRLAEHPHGWPNIEGRP